MTISLILGALVGAILGLSGAGGGILAVPSLVFGMGWPMQKAAPVALLAVAGSAAIGAVEAFRKGLVRYRAALFMALTGVPTTWAGVRLAAALPQRILLALFSGVMLLVAVRMLGLALSRRAGQVVKSPLCVAKVNPGTGRLQWNRATTIALGATGATAGLMTGLLGVGGGFIIVPMLRKFTDVPMHGIVATSLMVVALVGCGGVLSSFAHGASIPCSVVVPFTVATATGMVGGRLASHRMSARHVQIGFGSILVCVAIGLLLRACFG